MIKFKYYQTDGLYALGLFDGDDYHNNMESVNDFAKKVLFMNVVKVVNILKNDYYAIIKKKEVWDWNRVTKSFAYFTIEDHAKAAADWLNSILVSNEMKGVDQLKQEAKNKKEASYEKRVNKKFQQATPFIGKDVIVNIKFSADGVISGDTTMHTKITFIGRVGKDKFVIQTFNGSFYATYSSFYFDENKMTLLNAGQTVKFEIE